MYDNISHEELYLDKPPNETEARGMQLDKARAEQPDEARMEQPSRVGRERPEGAREELRADVAEGLDGNARNEKEHRNVRIRNRYADSDSDQFIVGLPVRHRFVTQNWMPIKGSRYQCIK